MSVPGKTKTPATQHSILEQHECVIHVRSRWEASQVVEVFRNFELKLRRECPIGRTRLEDEVRAARLTLQQRSNRLPKKPTAMP